MYDAYAEKEKEMAAHEELFISRNSNLTPEITKEANKKSKNKPKWNLSLTKNKKPTPSTVQNEIIQGALANLKESETRRPSKFKRLLKEEKVKSRLGEKRLLRSAKVLERMVIQDENKDIAFGKYLICI